MWRVHLHARPVELASFQAELDSLLALHACQAHTRTKQPWQLHASAAAWALLQNCLLQLHAQSASRESTSIKIHPSPAGTASQALFSTCQGKHHALHAFQMCPPVQLPAIHAPHFTTAMVKTCTQPQPMEIFTFTARCH
jgi:hypothetical protein